MVATQLGMELGQGEVLLLGRRIRDKLGSWLVLPLIPGGGTAPEGTDCTEERCEHRDSHGMPSDDAHTSRASTCSLLIS